MGVKTGHGKTKGTEHRITLNEPKREWELGSGEAALAAEWAEVLRAWIGLPKVDLPYISPVSPLYLPYISGLPNVEPQPEPCPSPSPSPSPAPAPAQALPKVERIESSGGSRDVVKAQWMEARPP